MQYLHKQEPTLECFPAELVQHIFRCLCARDLIVVGKVCKNFYSIQQEETVWKSLFQTKWPILYGAVIGAQSRWDFSSLGSRMFLFYIDTVVVPSHWLYLKREKDEDSQGWIKQKHIKRTKVEQTKSTRDDDMRDDTSESDKLKEYRKEERKKKRIEMTQMEIHCTVQLMKMYPTKLQLQQEVCYVLRRLCYQPLESSNADANQKYIALEDGIPLIFDLMKENQNHAALQMEATAALINLALNDLNKETIAQLGGIPLIVQCMRGFPDDVPILQFCCSVLWNLSCNENNKVLIAKEGAIELIINAMNTHKQEAKLQAKACGALRNIGRNHESNRNAIIHHNGIEAILATVKTHQLVPNIQCEAFRTLYNIGRNISDLVLINEGVQLIIDAMQIHRDDANVQYESCMALAGLSYKENRDLTNGGIQLVMRAMVNHSSNVEIQKIGAAYWLISH